MYELINDRIERDKFVVPCKTKKRSSLRKRISDYVASANEGLLPERRVTLKNAFTVAERSLNNTKDLSNETRVFLAFKEVTSYVSLCATGKGDAHFDLLPIGHPLSTKTHRMNEFALRNERAHWVAADPRIDDTAREIVLSAFQYPFNSVERSHATTRLTALSAGLVPREVVLSALTAAFSFGAGNSSAARSLRAKLQWRDRIGRWIEMGRGINFKVKLPNGLVATARGKFVGQGKGGQNVGLIQVKGDANIPDGIYPVDGSNANAFKALLPESAVKGMKPGKLSQILDRRAKILTLDEVKALRQDAPDGWTKNKDGSFNSDDDYIVEEKDGKLSLFRKDKDGNKGTQVGESVDDWAQIQDLANADQKDYDKFKRIASAPENKDALPGTELDPYDKLPENTKAFLKKQEEDDARKEQEDIDFKKKKNEEIDKFEEDFDNGKDFLGRDIPDGWLPEVGQGADIGKNFYKVQDGVEIVAYLNDEGKIRVGTPSQWIGEVDSWDDIDSAVAETVNSTFASDRKMLTDIFAYGDRKAKAAELFASDPNFLSDVANADNPLSRTQITERLRANEKFMEAFNKGDYDAREFVKTLRVRGNSMPYGKTQPGDDWVSLDDMEKLHQKVNPGARFLKHNVRPFEANGLTFTREDAYMASLFPDIAVFDGDKKIVDIAPNGSLHWADEIKPADYSFKVKKAIASLDIKEDFNDADTQLTKAEYDSLIQKMGGKSSGTYAELEGLDFMRTDPIYAPMDNEVQVYDGFDGADDAGPQVPIATIYDDGSVEWPDKETYDKYSEKFKKAVKSDDFDDSDTQLTPEERAAFIASMSDKEFEEREGLQFFRQDPIYAKMADEIEVYDDYDGADDAGRQVPVATIFGDGSVEWRDKEAFDKFNKAFIKATKSFEAKKPAKTEAEKPKAAEKPSNEVPDFDIPKGGFKLNLAAFQPEGRVDDEMSPDFTDDPERLANKFGEQELIDALKQALVGDAELEFDSKGNPKPVKVEGLGSGQLEFKGGDEWVPAEAIFLALKEQGADVDLIAAEIYDDPTGETKNQDLIEQSRKSESVEAQGVTPNLDKIDLYDPEELARVNIQLAQVEAAGGIMAELEKLSMQEGEPNPKIDEMAEEIRTGKDFRDLLMENINLAFSDDENDRQAFKGLWGLLVSLDGGISNGMAVGTELNLALADAYKEFFGVEPDDDAMVKFWKDNGDFVALFESRLKLSNGEESLKDPESFAGAWFRLVAATSRYNDQGLHRGMQVPNNPEDLAKFEKGGILSFDARPFSKDANMAAMYAGFASKNKDIVGVIFNVPQGKARAADVSSVSPFADEQEVQVWGNFRITDVRETVNQHGKKFLNVTVERLDKREAVLNGFDSDYENLLMKSNESPEMPEGFHAISPERYEKDETREWPEGFEDSPLSIAREYDKAGLAVAFRAGIEDGSGEVVLEREDGNVSVPAELVRDALQIQGVDTNSLLKDIANAGPEAKAEDKGDEDNAADTTSAVEEIVEEAGATYDIEGWKQVGPQLGSNEGGFYEDAEGNRFYVKKPKSELHAENEVLAAAFYNALGIRAADINKGEAKDGVIKTFSPDIEGSETLRDKLNDPDVIKKLQEGFAIDAWLANWDVAGLDFDNVMLDGEGNPVRVDPGGALLFRAMGAPKGSLFGDKATEIDSLRDPKMNPQSAEIFGTMTEEDMKESAKRLLDISNDEIDYMVDGLISDPEAAGKLKDTLKSRRQDILERFDLLGDDGSTLVESNQVEEETDPEVESAMTPEGFKGEVEQALDTAAGWAQEYAEDDNILNSQKKAFQQISDRIDMLLVQWRDGSISDEDLPDKIQEVRDFLDTFNFGSITDDDVLALNHADDVDEQLRVLQELAEENVKKNKPEEATPEVTPAVEETPAAEEVPTSVAPGEDNPAYKDGNGNIIRNKKGDVYIYRKKGQPDVEVTFSRYDPANTGYVYMYMGDGKKPKAISTKKLFKKEDGGGDTGPKVDEAPSAPQPVKPEAPTPQPEPQEQKKEEPKAPGKVKEYADKLEKALAYFGDDIEELRAQYKDNENVLRELDTVNERLGAVWSHVGKMQEYIDEKSDEDTVEDFMKEGAREAFVELDKMQKDYMNVRINNNITRVKDIVEAQLTEWGGDLTPGYSSGDVIDQEQQESEETEAPSALTPPPGVVSAPGMDGKPIFAGVEVIDKAGTISTVTKVNNKGYALVSMEDGSLKWRSVKTLNSTGKYNKAFAKTNKPTGAGVPPVTVLEPADWSSSAFEDLPSLTGAIEKVMDESDKNNAMGGASAAVDSDSIEDLDVRVMRVKTQDGLDGVRLKFKLTNWAGNKKAAELMKMGIPQREEAGVSQRGSLFVEKISIGPDGIGQLTQGSNGTRNDVEEYEDSYGTTWTTLVPGTGIIIKFHRANKDATSNVKKRTDYQNGGPLAFHNLVTIQAPPDAKPEEIAQALKLAGVEDVRPATQEDANVLIENRLMSIFDRQTDARTNLKGDEREASLQKIKDKWGLTVADVKITKGASGRLETRLSEEGARKIWEATGKPRAIHHSITSNILDASEYGNRPEAIKEAASWFANLFTSPHGGLLSTTTRWTEGVGMQGMSSDEDIQTGGADYVFATPSTASTIDYGTNSVFPYIYFDPIKLYQRLDFFANTYDAYGERAEKQDVISAAELGRSKEIMFKGRIGWEDLSYVIVAEDVLPLLMEEFKKKGVTQVGGRPIEELFVEKVTK